ncbi:MAG: uroporphyrinogen decarboxylase family protein [Spirochaetia bacterium]
MTDTSTKIQERKKRWIRGLSPENRNTFLFMIEIEGDAKERPVLQAAKMQERIEWAWRKYNTTLDRMARIDDDRLPYLDIATGTEIFAQAFGCSVHYPEDSNPFALPLVRSASEAEKITVPSIDSPPLALPFAMADELYKRADGQALIKLPDIQSPMDITALIWDKNDFFIAMLETPDAVVELAEKVYSLLTAFLDEWFSRYGSEFIAHYPQYYMPRGITLSEDEIGAVNSDIFRQLFRPELERLSERYGGIGIHCCADARHQWENLREIPDLKVLNLVNTFDYITEAYPFFKDTTLQMHSLAAEGDPWTWPGKLPEGGRYVLSVTANDEEEAARTALKLREAVNR